VAHGHHCAILNGPESGVKRVEHMLLRHGSDGRPMGHEWFRLSPEEVRNAAGWWNGQTVSSPLAIETASRQRERG
jgi:hypothetical protein